jgi:ABC-type lipoprotein export system ATPase subunit
MPTSTTRGPRREWHAGSVWQRWDPHVHAPETALNDQFGTDAWDPYLSKIETASPSVVGLGIADYFTLHTYRTILDYRQKGRLASVPFLFANVELRMMPRASGSGPLNVHLLLSPQDPDHVVKFENAMTSIKFRYTDENYPCTESGLIALGKAILGKGANDIGALRKGAEQFKVDVGDFRTLLETDPWLRKNCLIAVPNGNDGAGGLGKEGSYAAQADEFKRMANVIFSGNPKDRAYWLGKGTDSVDVLKTRFGGTKPCLHGCDAHCLHAVLAPEEDRYCWIRSAPTWDGLRQVLFEPEERVFIGSEPPHRARKNWIKRVQVSPAGGTWFPEEALELNEGLVAIIGPRGSGKTALADLIAFGADAYDRGPASFLNNAEELITGTGVVLTWADQRKAEGRVVGDMPTDESPSVRYLSQQFVESLCSSTGASDRLVEEIEKVVFDRLEAPQRYDATSFDELRQIETASATNRIAEIAEEIRECTAAIAEAVTAAGELPGKREKLTKIDAEIVQLTKEQSETVVKADPEKMKRLETLTAQTHVAQQRLTAINDKLRKAQDFEADLARLSTKVEELNSKYAATLVDLDVPEADRSRFLLRFTGDYNEVLENTRRALLALQKKEMGEGVAPTALPPDSYAALRIALATLQKDLSADSIKQKKLAELTKKLGDKQEARRKLDLEIKAVDKSREGIVAQQERRFVLYRSAFEEFTKEEEILSRLYRPLRESLQQSPENERGLEFYVRRVIDVDAWAERGEALLDLRKRGEFNEHGALAKAVRKHLLNAWTTGDPEMLNTGMRSFVKELGDWRQLLSPASTPVHFAEWLFSLDHLKTTYGIRYAGTDIERLSPGTRGIVLLILYLALDEEDDSPLIVDQPEENLDPQSIFQELVGYFLRARRRRQVIVVTHNANLVVNTDADQVVVANATREHGRQMPNIRYVAGPLELGPIRDRVCDILEGGAEAFRRRELRYGLRLPSAE